ncbi:DNA-processing protein DprA [bacterium]|nr:DNA-processing protein DprA [bacterium]
MDNKKLFLHLSLIDGIGPVTIKKLVDAKPADMNMVDLYQMTSSDIVHRFHMSRSVAQKIVQGLSSDELLNKELALIEKYNVQFTTLGSREYPEFLANIHAPPAVLYWLGEDVFKKQKTIAVIGSRCAHRYSQQVIDQFIPELVANDWVIISGGAIGADSMAHHATVKAQGKTVVVFGSGLLCPYPSSNRKLFESILHSGGTLMSAFPLMTQPRPGNFPARNRIIAGLSRGCLVVQAAHKSGARITAQFALDQGREVFAVPGPIDDPLSAGCHGLIQQGAKLVCTIEDILLEFEPLFGTFKINSLKKEDRIVQQKRSGTLPTVKKIEKKIIHSKKIFKKEPGIPGEILQLCEQPSTTDQVMLALNIDLEHLHELLFDLQLQGKLIQNFAGLWERV